MTALKAFQPLRGDLFTHQRAGIREGLKFPAFGLFFEPRLGKTRVALGILGHRWNNGEVRKALIAAPQEVFTVWEDQMAEACNYPYKIFDASYGERQKRIRIISAFSQAASDGVSALFINYESAWRHIELLSHCGIEMIICDEGHLIKGPDSERSKAMHHLGDRTPYKIDSTGTPTPESPMDIWSQYRFLRPSIFGSDFELFRERYEITRPVINPQTKQLLYTKSVGVRRKSEISKLMHQICIRRTMDECLDMPPINHINRRVKISAESLALEKKVWKDEELFVGSVKLTRATLSDAAMKSQQIGGGFLKHHEKVIHIGDEKGNHLIEILGEMDRKEKVVVFTHYSHEIKYLVNRINTQARRECEPVEGGKNNRKTIGRFKQGLLNAIVCQSGVGSLGQDFSEARLMIFYSVSNKYQDFYQARMRLLGPRQKRKVSYIYLKAEGTSDDDYYEALERKRDVEEYLCEKYRVR